MITSYKYMICLCILICAFGQVYGQAFDDLEGRPGIAVEHEFDNGIKARVRYRHSLDSHLSHFKSSGLDIKVEYKVNINSWWEPAIDYRYKFKGEDSYHDIRYSAKFSQDLGKNLVLEYVPKFQQKLAAEKRPEFYIRNELALIYNLSKDWSISVFSENYQSVDKGIRFDTQKNGIETEFALNKKSELEFGFDIKNQSDHQDISRLTLTFTYIIQ